jgi:hypothetical protein
MPKRSKRRSTASFITSADVRHLVGPVTDDTVLAILECGASVEDLEVAMNYVLGEGSAVDRVGHPMTGKIARLYDILSSDELYANADER